MADWDEMKGAVNRAGGAPQRDIVHFLHTEKDLAIIDNDTFLTNIYGQAIREIEGLRELVDNLRAEIQYYQQLTKE